MSQRTTATDIGILVLALVLAGLAVRCEPICGQRQTTATSDITIGCIDYDRLRAVAPGAPWPSGSVTQVLILATAGDSVRVTVDGKIKWADLVRDAYGRLAAMVTFKGMDHTSVAVKVKADVP